MKKLLDIHILRKKDPVKYFSAFDKSNVGPHPFPWKSKELIALTVFGVVMYVAISYDSIIIVKCKENVLTPGYFP